MREGTARVEVERDQGDMSAPGRAGQKSRSDASEKMKFVRYPMHLSLWRALENGQSLERIGKARGKFFLKAPGWGHR